MKNIIIILLLGTPLVGLSVPPHAWKMLLDANFVWLAVGFTLSFLYGWERRLTTIPCSQEVKVISQIIPITALLGFFLAYAVTDMIALCSLMACIVLLVTCVIVLLFDIKDINEAEKFCVKSLLIGVVLVGTGIGSSFAWTYAMSEQLHTPLPIGLHISLCLWAWMIGFRMEPRMVT